MCAPSVALRLLVSSSLVSVGRAYRLSERAQRSSKEPNQRDGRLAALLVRDVFLSGVAFLLTVVFAVAAFLRATFFVGAVSIPALLADSTVRVPGAGATVDSSSDDHRTRMSEPVTAVTTPS